MKFTGMYCTLFIIMTLLFMFNFWLGFYMGHRSGYKKGQAEALSGTVTCAIEKKTAVPITQGGR